MKRLKSRLDRIKKSAQAWCNFEALESLVENVNCYQLVNLPTELLQQIFKYVTLSDTSSVISIMILRATCQRFRCFFDDPLATIDPAAKSAMLQRYSYFMRSKHLNKLIRSETRDCLVCIACMRLLPAKLFFSTAVYVPSHKRLCKGHEGELNLFGPRHEHRTWEELHIAGLQFWHPVPDYWRPSVSPVDRHCGIGRYGSLRGDGRFELGPTEKAQKGVFLGPRSAHDHYYGSIEDKRLAIEAADYLLRREWVLQPCEAPHMGGKTVSTVCGTVDSVLSRVAYQNRLGYTNLCPHMDGRTVDSERRVRKLLQSKTYECPMQSCKTWLWIEQQKLKPCSEWQENESAKSHGDKVNGTSYTEEAKGWLVLVVVRNVGSMNNPTDPKWIAQLGAPRWTGTRNYCPPLWLTSGVLP
ncbi:hypothetical protein P171DRAFT_481471 [Karstenula rhodostoma CBS 690.94]|uniref:F-box domain-containing protein n=1 Tax=Karstenula rhodostoma CBS 690.94 TaxID=1392251 RepID=A0A9P4UGD1_9PLEO|nr:hypothetical protein P171DRAFT_481471 [Karstenula rhodostoma CBS 690.94]